MSFGDSLNLGLSDSLQSIKNAAGVVGTGRNTISGGSDLPWVATPAGSLFYSPIDIQADRWNQLFPYRLIVVDVTNGNNVVGGTYGAQGVRSSITSPEGPGSAIVSFSPLTTSWVFTLPISPTQLNIQDQYAITNTATLRGVLEEHSGARFKMINAQGTMGVWPYRESVTKPPGTPGILQSLFGGTLQNLGNVVGQVNRVVNSAVSGHPASKPKTISPANSTFGETSTGYYQALALQQFLEQYAEAKKLPQNAGWRLVFDIPKQNQSFVVTPNTFVWQQNASKPLEINFSLAFKAWRRIELGAPATPAAPDVYKISPGILQRVLTTITEARSVLSASLDLIGAVRSDVTRPLEVLRQTSLLTKDLLGVIATAADLPFQIQKDYSSSVKQSLLNLKDGINTTSSNPKVRAAMVSIASSSATNEGLSFDAVQSGQLGAKASAGQSIDPANNVFAKPEANFDLMNSVPVTNMQLGPAKQAVVNEALASASDVTVDDLKSYRAVIQDLALQLSNNFGSGDAFYNKVYNRPAPKARIQPLTLDEYDILNKLYDTMQAFDILTATSQINDRNKQTNMEYVAGLASDAGIQFNISKSKILAPVPFGLTMEGIAARYLGDPQRWLEIATLNNLRDPYIDENGFQYPLLSNATGRQITISSQENLYVGQRIVLQSASQVPSARRILGIDRLSDTSFLLSLDGEANLDTFVLADAAYLQAYLPGTVNSQQKIFIPSDLPVPASDGITTPSSVASDPLVGLSKVDLLLTDSGDFATNSFGDLRFSAGITNIIQALKIKIGTTKGSSLLYPTFGLGLKSGMSNSDANVNAIYQSISAMIAEDPRFQGLESLQVILNGPTMTINMAVALAGRQGVFPISFELAS